MVKFRWHRGSYVESIATTKVFKSKKDIERLVTEEFRKWGETKFEFTYDYVCYDERCDWFTWYVCLNGQCIGMAELRRLPDSMKTTSGFARTSGQPCKQATPSRKDNRTR